jgi:hypothetical protein
MASKLLELSPKLNKIRWGWVLFLELGDPLVDPT